MARAIRGFALQLTELQQQLASIDHDLAQAFESIGDQPLLFSHPVYQYLEERYSLHGHSLHWEPGEAPTEGQWAELDEVLADHPAKLMIWEGQPLESTVTKLEQRGITPILFDPGANCSQGGYLELMQENLRNLDSH